jgi:hypothetical protein
MKRYLLDTSLLAAYLQNRVTAVQLIQPLMFLLMKMGLSLEKSVPGCLDKEVTVLIGYHRYILALLCDKEPVIDGLLYHLAFLASS